MSDKKFQLEIVTPQRVVFKGDVESFTAPGVMGSFQVLVNHAPLLSAIGVGEAKMRDTQGNEIKYATSGGFVEVMNNRVVMLAESAERSNEIDVQRAEKAKSRAKDRLEQHPKEIDIERARAALARALNRLKIAGRA
ncbi:MAG: F0F1 ATP synthase subunit epsilon [Ignavibacteriae bacterium]|nr:F0F1 ATP synthase subunit epsilon [Ignavibacteriota bacterium]